MRDNTPPRILNIEEDENDNEDVFFDPDDEEFEEVSLEDLEDRLPAPNNNGHQILFETPSPDPPSPVPDDAILTFREHASSVFSCSLHPTKDWAVTGGEDDQAIVWNTQTGETIYAIDGHLDTVIEANFNHDGSYLATGDMAGEIQVLKTTPELSKILHFSVCDICWMKWHRSANVLMAGSDEGEIYIWRIPSGECKILAGNGHKCETAELTADGKKLFAGYGDGKLKLWDIKTNSVIMEVEENHPMRHTENVSTVSCDRENPVYMSGSEDGKILFLTNSGPVGCVEAGGAVECVTFSPSAEFKVAASGTLNGKVAIWDYAKHSMRTLCEHPEINNGVTIMKWISDYILLVGTIQGNIYGYDARSGIRKFHLSGHTGDIYAMQYNPQEQTVLTVSEDKTAKIFKCPPLID